MGLSISSINWERIATRNSNQHIVGEIGLSGYALNEGRDTISNWLSERRIAFQSTEDLTVFINHIQEANNIAKRSDSTLPPPSKKRKNLIYIQMESVDAIAIQAIANGEVVMPFLNQLSKTATNFSNTVDNTSSGRTTDGEILVLTSLPPLFGKPIYPNYDLSKVPSLPHVLNEAGYYTFSIHGFDGQFWNRANAHSQLGYQDRFYFDDLDQSDTIGWGISDRSILQQAAKKISESERPVFAHIILLTNHHPYDHVAAHQGLPTGDIVNDHIISLRYVDDSIRSFFETLKDLGIIDNCLIAIYSDHDSAIRDELRNAVKLPSPPIVEDSVPLIIYGLTHPAKDISKASALQDLPVIALEDLSLPTPRTFIGNSLHSPEPVLLNTGQLLLIKGSKATRKKAPFDVKRLTKTAILAPHRLDPKP